MVFLRLRLARYNSASKFMSKKHEYDFDRCISTEMDASSKQKTIAEKFVAAWEKKNAKAVRAGGVSLMALSLAACGSDDTTTTTTTDTSTSTDTTTTDTTTTTTTTPVAQTFSLTKSSVTGALDNIAGGDGDDTVNANADGFLETGDVIDGGAGTDTINHVQADQTIDQHQNEKVYIQVDGIAGTKTLTFHMQTSHHNYG